MRPWTCSIWSPISSAIPNLRPFASPRASVGGGANLRERKSSLLIWRLDTARSVPCSLPEIDFDRAKGAISIVHLTGPFKHFESSWSFRDLPRGGSRIVFSTRYQFSNPALEFLFAPVFDRVVSGLTRAFEVRANEMAKARLPDQGRLNLGMAYDRQRARICRKRIAGAILVARGARMVADRHGWKDLCLRLCPDLTRTSSSKSSLNGLRARRSGAPALVRRLQGTGGGGVGRAWREHFGGCTFAGYFAVAAFCMAACRGTKRVEGRAPGVAGAERGKGRARGDRDRRVARAREGGHRGG